MSLSVATLGFRGSLGDGSFVGFLSAIFSLPILVVFVSIFLDSISLYVVFLTLVGAYSPFRVFDVLILLSLFGLYLFWSCLQGRATNLVLSFLLSFFLFHAISFQS